MTETRAIRLVIAGGGTGGHLFPGIALAKALQRRLPESRVLFIGTSRLIDRQALKDQDFEVTALETSGVKGLGLKGLVKSLASQPRAIMRAAALLRSFKPDVVFGVGGYVTGPVLLAAKLLGIPTAIHEQNSVPGLANRLTGRFVDKICVSLPCKPAFPAKKTVATGNPVRADILAAGERERRVLQPGDTPRILVLGGSQGAHAVNEKMCAAAAGLRRDGHNIYIRHQTGRADEDKVRAAYAEAGVNAEVSAFITDMAAAYGDADLAVSRAGATSLAELAVVGLPAVLIPYPFAADDHQATNAAHYAAGGGAVVFPEKTLTAEALAGQIRDLLADGARLREMGAAMRALAKPQAAEHLVDECLALVAEGAGDKR